MVNDPVNSVGNLPALPDDPGQFILYQTEDGQTRIEVRFFSETVWLSQKPMAELFQKDVSDHQRAHPQHLLEKAELARTGSYPEIPDNCRRRQAHTIRCTTTST